MCKNMTWSVGEHVSLNSDMKAGLKFVVKYKMQCRNFLCLNVKAEINRNEIKLQLT